MLTGLLPKEELMSNQNQNQNNNNNQNNSHNQNNNQPNYNQLTNFAFSNIECENFPELEIVHFIDFIQEKIHPTNKALIEKHLTECPACLNFLFLVKRALCGELILSREQQVKLYLGLNNELVRRELNNIVTLCDKEKESELAITSINPSEINFILEKIQADTEKYRDSDSSNY